MHGLMFGCIVFATGSGLSPNRVTSTSLHDPLLQNRIFLTSRLYSLVENRLDFFGQCHVKASEGLSRGRVWREWNEACSACDPLERLLADAKSHAANRLCDFHDAIPELMYDVLAKANGDYFRGAP